MVHPAVLFAFAWSISVLKRGMCSFCINCTHAISLTCSMLQQSLFRLLFPLMAQYSSFRQQYSHRILLSIKESSQKKSSDCREAPCGWGSEIHSLYDSLLSSQTLWSELVIWVAFPLCLSGLLWSFAPVAKGSVLWVWFGGYGTPSRLFVRLSLFTLPSCFQLNPPSFSPTSLLLSFPSPIRVDCEGKEGGVGHSAAMWLPALVHATQWTEAYSVSMVGPPDASCLRGSLGLHWQPKKEKRQILHALEHAATCGKLIEWNRAALVVCEGKDLRRAWMLFTGLKKRNVDIWVFAVLENLG